MVDEYITVLLPAFVRFLSRCPSGNPWVAGTCFAELGCRVIQKRVVVIAEETDAIAVRPMMYATLTFDHRVADGAVGDAFLAAFKQALEGWE